MSSFSISGEMPSLPGALLGLTLLKADMTSEKICMIFKMICHRHLIKSQVLAP